MLIKHIFHSDTVESQFFERPRETKIGLKNWIVWEIGGKITVFDWGEENNFWFELSGGSNEGLRNRDSSYIGWKFPTIFQDIPNTYTLRATF